MGPVYLHFLNEFAFFLFECSVKRNIQYPSVPNAKSGVFSNIFSFVFQKVNRGCVCVHDVCVIFCLKLENIRRSGGCCSSFDGAAVSFGGKADYPVVMDTANRKCPVAGSALGLFQVRCPRLRGETRLITMTVARSFHLLPQCPPFRATGAPWPCQLRLDKGALSQTTPEIQP